MQQFLPLLGQDDPMGTATAALEARRRQQIEGAGYDPDQGLYDRYSAMLGSVLGPTISERAVAAREAMRRGDMATANALNQSLALDFGQFLGSIKPIRAYHGSPHDFDKFDMSKIGSGEGAQAYGHGLYFAEAEDVARTYRNDLSRRNVTGTFDGMPLDSPRDWWSAVDKVSGSDWRVGKFLDLYGRVGGDKDWFVRQMRVDYADQPKMLAALEDFAQRIDASHRPGRMYEVNIHADPERFLDWDKPLSAQPQAWQRIAAGWGGEAEAAERLGLDPNVATGRQYLDAVAPQGRGEAFAGASRRLAEEGIPGIRYFDAGSRTAGDGSRNYVVFDDKLIEILRKYGLLPPVAAGGAAALSSEAEAAP